MSAHFLDHRIGLIAAALVYADVLHLLKLKLMLKANGRRGVPRGGVISPLLSNLYLNCLGFAVTCPYR
jgi:RNA-directed DNA polymerase